VLAIRFRYRPWLCRPVTLRCLECGSDTPAYEDRDSACGTLDWVDQHGDPVDKCQECGSPCPTVEVE